ncbi:MAG: MarR family transcriptional regulator [Deltaproteobacteria bacterium]|nr:MarR family transcriptional regulator [Deltaproteobacteria bacterium]
MKKTIQQALRAIEQARHGNSRGIDSSAAAIFMRLAALSRRLNAFHSAALKSEGLSTSEYQLLALAWSLGPQPPRDLNGLLLLTSGALTNALDRLQQAGHIRRRRNPEDGRSVIVELTAGGSRLAERLVPLEMAAQARQLAALSRAEKREVVTALDRLIDVF